VLFPSTAAEEGTLAARVLAAAADGAPADGITLRFTMAHREPLEVRAPVSVSSSVSADLTARLAVKVVADKA